MATHPWAKFAIDSDESYSAFSEWLHLDHEERPDPYDYAKTVAPLRKPSDVLRWAREGLWEQRASAYDDWTKQGAARKFFPLTLPMALQCQALASVELGKYLAAQAKAGDAPGFIPLSEVIRLVRLVQLMESHIAKIRQAEKEMKAEGSASIDASRYTPEELTLLTALIEKGMVT